jgi:hypothetical protein
MMEPYPSGQFGFIDDPDCSIGNSSVSTRTRTLSDGPEPLLTLPILNDLGVIYIVKQELLDLDLKISLRA